MKYLKIVLLLIFIIPITAWAAPDVPVANTVTMVDIGSTTCIPCKMMNPVLKSLRAKYKERAAIIFSDINKSEREARKFGINVIPTQIFFDRHGKEIWRHTGFLDLQSCEKQINLILTRP
ncbi:thioredoxin family protein [Desulfobacterota bacterium M19]